MKLATLPTEEPSLSVENELENGDDDRSFYLPRLTEDAYQGLAVVHWTLTLQQGEKILLDELFHLRLRDCLMHTFARKEGAGLMCPVYCVMPDHLHMVWMGTNQENDQRRAMAFFRTYLKGAIAPARLQPQAHDHVLREDERRRRMFATVCNYILVNPVEAGLVKTSADWKFSGCVVPGYPTLHPSQPKFWGVFWRIYWKKRGKNNDQIAKKPEEPNDGD